MRRRCFPLFRDSSHGLALASVGLVLGVGLPGLVGCGDKDDAGGAFDSSGLDTGNGSLSGDGDGGDEDGGGDGDGDGGALDLGGQPPPPEEEEEGDFRVPQPSGRYVYAASETTDRVAVIDSGSLGVRVVDVCRRPTVLEPIPSEGDGGAVAVLCQGSNEVALLRTSAGGNTTVELRPITKGANALIAAPDGAWVLAFHDVDAEVALGPGSDQEVTALETRVGGAGYGMIVGSHPREIVFSPAGERAFAVTDDGVNVIEMDQVDAVGKPRLVQVVEDPGIDPSTVEIQISTQRNQALARADGRLWVVVTDLDSGARTQIDLPTFATDLDVAPDGSFAVMALPNAAGSQLLEFPLPLTGPQDFSLHPVGAEYVGLLDLTPDGDTMVLYTTQNPWAADPGSAPLGDPRQRITLARRDGGDWQDQVTIFTQVPVRAVGVAPDSANAVLLHEADAGLNPAAPWPYTLLDLTAAFPVSKLQTSLARPGPVVFAADGSRVAIRVRSENTDIRQLELVSLDSFVVQRVQLASLPEGVAHVDSTDKFYVSQAHPSGRITFIDATGDVQTLTGYELNDAIKD